MVMVVNHKNTKEGLLCVCILHTLYVQVVWILIRSTLCCTEHTVSKYLKLQFRMTGIWQHLCGITLSWWIKRCKLSVFDNLLVVLSWNFISLRGRTENRLTYKSQYCKVNQHHVIFNSSYVQTWKLNQKQAGDMLPPFLMHVLHK